METWAELLEAWLALTSVKEHDNLLILMLLDQWLALTMLVTTQLDEERARCIQPFLQLPVFPALKFLSQYQYRDSFHSLGAKFVARF